MRFLIKLFPFVFLVLLLILPVLIREKHFTDEASDSKDFVLTTGETSGIYNPLGKAMASLLNRDLKRHRIVAIESNGSVQNLRRLNNLADFAILQGDIAESATHEYIGLPDASNVRGVMVLYKEFLQIYVKKDSKINSVKDLKGKTVSVGLRGSAITRNAQAIFEASDIDFDMEVNKRYYPLEQSLSELDHGTIDAVFFFGGRGIYEVEKVNKHCPLKMLPVTDEAIDFLISHGDPVIKFHITQNDYSFVKNPVVSIGQVAILACKANTPDWIVCRFRQTVLAHTDILEFAHPIASEIKTVDQSLMPIELHQTLSGVTYERLEYFNLAIFLAAAVLILAFAITLNVIAPNSFQRFKNSVLNFNRSYITILIIMLILLAVMIFIGAFILLQSESYVAGTNYDNYANSLKNMTYAVMFAFDSQYMPVSSYGTIIINLLFITYLLIILLLSASVIAILFKPYGKLKPMQFHVECPKNEHLDTNQTKDLTCTE